MTDTINNPETTSDERLLSLFSHLSTFVGGIILPIIFWAIHKDKSKFVRFHSLQAIFFHIVYLFFVIVMTIFGTLFMSLGMVGLGTATNYGSKGMPVLMIILIIVFVIVLFVVIFGTLGYSIYVGIKAYKGELKKYPIIGNIIYKKVYGA